MSPEAITVLIMAVFASGFYLAKFRRALSDLRKTIAGIPGMRKAMRGEAARLLFAGAVIFLLVYAWMNGR